MRAEDDRSVSGARCCVLGVFTRIRFSFFHVFAPLSEMRHSIGATDGESPTLTCPYSLDWKEGHTKKNSLCVCVFVSGSKVKGQKNIIFETLQKSKKHRFGWVQRSKEHGMRWVKGQKNIFSKMFKSQRNIVSDGFIPSTVRRVIWKKISLYVCGWLSGSKVKCQRLLLFPRLKGGLYEIKWVCMLACLYVCLHV